MALTPEGKFQKKVMKDLSQIQGIYFFKKEAAALRGISDIIGCLNGLFFALELKKSLAATRRSTGRIVLQKYHIDLVVKSGGFARLSCPETWENDLKELVSSAGLDPSELVP